MTWNIGPECVSVVFLCIIWTYSRKGNLVPTTKNRLFEACLVTTFCAMSTNILSTLLIYLHIPQTLLFTRVITLIYFIATPLMGFVYFLYAVANIYEDEKTLRRYFAIAAVPGALYLGLVVTNPFTRVLFNITAEEGYTQGPLIATTYIIFYIYCIGYVLLVAIEGKRVEPAIRAILFSFPLIAGLVIVIQLLAPSVILSGSAATAALLVIYLYLQNKQISMDYLTHLPNRLAFLRMLEVYLRKKLPFSIVVLSLREFKNINDTHGQQNGDALLVSLSTFLRKELGLRNGEIYRYSGDEFSLLLRDANQADLTRLVLRIRERMVLAWDVPGCTCMLSAALGIASYPHTSDDTAGLINGLEYAVMQAKRDPDRENVCFCTPELLKISKRRHLIVHELEDHLAHRSFEVHYQPIFSVKTGEFVHAEALLRMPSTVLERIFPDEFIPVAEESGLIIDITYFVLETVCLFLQRLARENLALESVNVNFSAVQFSQKDMIARTLSILEQHGVAHDKITIELTESSLAENAEIITASLREISERGIHIGLDDFGTGYSNLISVLDLPINTVKLDKSIVWSALKNERCSIAVQNFCRAFRELGMTVLAEGVETQSQREFVVDAGCTMIQGYFYAKPMSEEDFIAFLKQHNTPAPAQL